LSRLSPRNCFVKIGLISFCIIPFRFGQFRFDLFRLASISFRFGEFRLVSFRFVSVYFVSRFVSQFTGIPYVDISNWVWFLVRTTLINDSQNHGYLDTIQVKSKILYFKYVLFMQIWLTYGTAWVSEYVFSNFEDFN
jgi:hypothetical protein